MTIVAAYSHDGYIYLFGDLLLSDKRDDRPSIELPTSGPNPGLRIDGDRVVDLRQKITVIAPYCAVGFAGDFENAQKLINTLKIKSSSSKRLSYDEVLEEINSASTAAATEGGEFSIVGWYCDADGICRTLRTRNATLHERADGGHLLVAGTGADFFLKAFEKMKVDFAQYKALFTNVDPRIHWVLIQAHLVGIEAMFREDSPTLRATFGGGYELISQWKKGFYKSGDVTLVLWEAFSSFKGRPKYRHNAFLAYKMAYINDALILRIHSLAGKEWDGREIVSRNTTYVALPPYTDPQQPFPDERESIQIDSQVVCHVVFVSVEDKLLGFFLDLDIGSERGVCKNVAFTYSGVKGKRSFVCEISETRKQSFKEGILDMVQDRPARSFPGKLTAPPLCG